MGHFLASGSLPPGQDQPVTNNVPIPPDFNANYYVIIVADGLQQIYEADKETNNVLASATTMSVTGDPRPNLAPFKPAGWSDKLVVSTVTNTSADSAVLMNTNVLYVDWAVINNGRSATLASFVTELYVDEVWRASWTNAPGLGSNAVTSRQDFGLGLLSAGDHLLRLKTDAANSIDEFYEGDNEYTRTIMVIAPQELLVSTNSVTVPEGLTGSFTVRLALAPTNNVVATVVRSSGDSDLSVVSNATVTFTPGNWSTPQTVVIAAAEDADAVNETATFTVSAPGLTNVIITATESENDLAPLLLVTPSSLNFGTVVVGP